jgi:hypothetical protein
MVPTVKGVRGDKPGLKTELIIAQQALSRLSDISEKEMTV